MSGLSGVRVRPVAPAGGGVAVYAAAVADAYRRLGAQLVTGSEDLTHVELSSGDDRGWSALREVQGRGGRYLVTLHDPGLPVRHPVLLPPGTARRLGPASVLAQKAVDLTTGRRVLQRHLEAAHGSVVTLAPAPGRLHVPHPLLTDGVARWDGGAPVLGFVGYWGPAKGAGTLLRAWRSVPTAPGRRLVVAGASGTRDPYDVYLRRRLRHVHGVEAPGHLPDAELDDWLVGLRAVVLPYRRSWPGGASGVAQRAAELGVPVIASDLPPLVAQLGEGGARWVPQGDAAALAIALREALEDPEPLRQRAEVARATVLCAAARFDELLATAATTALRR